MRSCASWSCALTACTPIASVGDTVFQMAWRYASFGCTCIQSTVGDFYRNSYVAVFFTLHTVLVKPGIVSN